MSNSIVHAPLEAAGARYIKTGNRISLLPVAQYCGLAAKLSEEHGAGRAAAMSSAFHASASGSPDAKEKLARLTPKELETVGGWSIPSPVTVDGQTLTYEQADKEQPVGLTLQGEWSDSGEVVTCGTLDFAWVLSLLTGKRAYVADMKKTVWTSSGPDSLQLLTYGYAWAKKHGCSEFCVGLWIIEDKEWVWSDKVYSVDDFDALDLWERIVYAALNRSGEASYGAHCSDCYGRLHCPEYTAPIAYAETALAPVTQSGPIEDGEKLGQLFAFAERIEGLLEAAKEQAKEAARRGVKVVHPVSGKVLTFTQCKGRESLNQAKLFEAIPDAKRFVERGNPYSRATWSKPKGGK